MEKSSKLLGTSEGIDRISYLPDVILHDILSSLDIFDVFHLSILSKRWNYIWRTMPYLNFDIINCCGRKRVNGHPEKFKDFINWALISQCTNNLVCFNLYCANLFGTEAIFRWVRVATRRNVQQLVLSFCPAEPFVELPYCVATSESLRVLKLQLSRTILKLPNHIGFCQLKLLHLVDVELSNEHLTSCLFTKCPVLEKLILQGCTFGTTIDIASTSLVYVSLQKDIDYEKIYDQELYGNDAEIYSNCNIKISCPNLKVLKYGAPMAKDIILENLFSIQVVHLLYDPCERIEELGMLLHKMIKNVSSTSALKLCLWSTLGLYKVYHQLRKFPVTFYMLKSLKLMVEAESFCMEVMMLLLKHSPNLEVLHLFSIVHEGCPENWKMNDTSESIVCLESHLKLIKFVDFRHCGNEMELLRFFLKNARVLEKLIIVWEDPAHLYQEESEKEIDIYEEASKKEVLKFSRTSSNVVVTFLDFNYKSRSKRSFYC